MATVTVRMSDEKLERLKLLAKHHGVSHNKLCKELLTAALAEFDVETRFRVRADRGSIRRGLAILNSLSSLDPG